MTQAYISTAAASGRVMKIVIAARYAEDSGVLIQGELGKRAFASLWFSYMCNPQPVVLPALQTLASSQLGYVVARQTSSVRIEFTLDVH